jgi:tripartite-type tricarboxylate transporter receptor subunit TctC
MQSSWKRREFLAQACAGVAALGAGPGLAQAAYPNRPIKLVVGFPPGGITDILFRGAAVEASKVLGQPIVVENKAGAAGVPAYLALKQAAADGYTIGGVNVALWRQPVLEDVPYDPLRDFTYILNIAEVVFAIVVAGNSPFKTWSDLLAFGRANPQKVSFGASPGLRQSAHVFMLEVMRREKLDWQPVGYPGGMGAINDVLGGHLAFTVDPVASAAPLARAGQLRLLAVTTEQRSKTWPQVPTMKELGYPLTIDSPIGVGGPAGLPDPVVKTLHDAFKFAIEQPSMVALFEKLDQSPRYMGTADLNRYVPRSEVEQRGLLTQYGFAKKR